ncbi:MAG: hypothetical protein JO138_13535 [Acidobacteriaceae bacterium]|nr:hypothetical protein [Acidobacteriaceae bacterium]
MPGEVHLWTASFSKTLGPTTAEILCAEEHEQAARFDLRKIDAFMYLLIQH